LHPYTSRAYLVGGCVRDLFLKREIKDLDVEVYDIDEVQFAALMKRIGAKGVGKSFFVYKWKEIDIALPRLERKVGAGHRGFEVSLAYDEKEASRRRDFTMNALMINIFTGEMVDHWGGLRDIRNRIIRVVDPVKFREDSLRVLRAMQFAARLGFRVEEKSVRLMRSIDLDDLTTERIFWEFEKMFYASNLHYGLFYLFELSIAQKLFGLELSSKKYVKTALEMQHGRKRFLKANYPYYFIYIISYNLSLSFTFLPEKLSAPGRYRKMLAKQIPPPKVIDRCHIAMIALHYPIREWLGNYLKGVREIAQEIGLFEKAYDGGIFAADVINDGFEGRAIAEELQRRRMAKIKREYC